MRLQFSTAHRQTDAQENDIGYTRQSGSALNPRHRGYETPGDGLQALICFRNLGIASHHASALVLAAVRTIQDQVARGNSCVGFVSLSLLSHFMQKSLSLFAGKEFEKPRHGLQEHR